MLQYFVIKNFLKLVKRDKPPNVSSSENRDEASNPATKSSADTFVFKEKHCKT